VLQQLWRVLGPYALLGVLSAPGLALPAQVHSSEVTNATVVLATRLLTAYTGGIDALGPEVFQNLTELFTDSFFWYAADRFLELHLPRARGNTFQYRFSYFGQYHHMNAPGLHHDNAPGVTHR
jgi:hypothetical protein